MSSSNEIQVGDQFIIPPGWLVELVEIIEGCRNGYVVKILNKYSKTCVNPEIYEACTVDTFGVTKNFLLWSKPYKEEEKAMGVQSELPMTAEYMVKPNYKEKKNMTYPDELKDTAQTLYEKNIPMDEIAKTLMLKYPKYKGKLNNVLIANILYRVRKERKLKPRKATSVNRSSRKPKKIVRTPVRGPTVLSRYKTGWVDLTPDQQKEVISEANKLHAQSWKWSAIKDHLTEEYPDYNLPLARHLAKIAKGKKIEREQGYELVITREDGLTISKSIDKKILDRILESI